VACITDKIQEARLRWYGHVTRREDENSMNRIMTAEINGPHSQGQQKKRWGNMIQQVSPIKERTYWWWSKEVEKKDQSGWPLPWEGLIQVGRRE